MNIIDADNQQANWITCGNEEARCFLIAWRRYVHDIDDIIDEGRSPEFIIATFMQAAFLYAQPFYLKNLIALQQIVINCTNAYADTVAWEKSDIEWKKSFADHYRHFGAEMVLAIAGICGGYTHMRDVSLILREVCWMEHHNEQGEAV